VLTIFITTVSSPLINFEESFSPLVSTLEWKYVVKLFLNAMVLLDFAKFLPGFFPLFSQWESLFESWYRFAVVYMFIFVIMLIGHSCDFVISWYGILFASENYCLINLVLSWNAYWNLHWTFIAFLRFILNFASWFEWSSLNYSILLNT